MNIDDVKQAEIPDGSILTAIFNRQKELMEKYHHIESSNGFNSPPAPWPIDDKFVQARIKDLFWRATEELSEALENRSKLFNIYDWRTVWESDHDARHFMEEIADAIHFLVEASIVANIDPATIEENSEYWSLRDCPVTYVPNTISHIAAQIGEVVFSMGLAANCLKNKPWKLTQVPTDKDKFCARVIVAWCKLANTLTLLNCTLEDVHSLYFKKAEVNSFRQRSNY